MPPDPPPAIAAALSAVDPETRKRLMSLRARIFDIAATLPVGRIEESLKWGQPSYATPDTKAAMPIRLGTTKAGAPALFTHCQSGVIATVQATAAAHLEFDGNRALHLPLDEPLPDDTIDRLIHAALTYRL